MTNLLFSTPAKEIHSRPPAPHSDKRRSIADLLLRTLTRRSRADLLLPTPDKKNTPDKPLFPVPLWRTQAGLEQTPKPT